MICFQGPFTAEYRKYALDNAYQYFSVCDIPFPVVPLEESNLLHGKGRHLALTHGSNTSPHQGVGGTGGGIPGFAPVHRGFGPAQAAGRAGNFSPPGRPGGRGQQAGAHLAGGGSKAATLNYPDPSTFLVQHEHELNELRQQGVVVEDHFSLQNVAILKHTSILGRLSGGGTVDLPAPAVSFGTSRRGGSVTFLVDPQGLGLDWLKTRNPRLKCIKHKPNDFKFSLALDECLGSGLYAGHDCDVDVMVENVQVDRYLDPLLSSIVQREVVHSINDGTEVVRFGNRKEAKTQGVPFRFYLQTTMANPCYTPEFHSMCTAVINFSASARGCEELLLRHVTMMAHPLLLDQQRDLYSFLKRIS